MIATQALVSNAPFAAQRSLRDRFHIVSYNGGCWKFPRDNGIRWFRVGRRGLGLWWRDSRIAGASGADVNGRLFPVGRYRVKVLGFDRG